jgi:hypothetical protein
MSRAYLQPSPRLALTSHDRTSQRRALPICPTAPTIQLPAFGRQAEKTLNSLGFVGRDFELRADSGTLQAEP